MSVFGRKKPVKAKSDSPTDALWRRVRVLAAELRETQHRMELMERWKNSEAVIRSRRKKEADGAAVADTGGSFPAFAFPGQRLDGEGKKGA